MKSTIILLNDLSIKYLKKKSSIIVNYCNIVNPLQATTENNKSSLMF